MRAGIAKPPTFQNVKKIFDDVIVAWRKKRGYDPHLESHASGFGWATREQLLSATAFGKRLIDPEMIANGKGAQTNLIKSLRGELMGVRMPLGGPYLGEEEIRIIIEWIDSGCLP